MKKRDYLPLPAHWLALIAIMATPLASSAQERCGLGLPPGAPGFAEAEARDEAQLTKQGFLQVCAANLARYDIDFGRAPGLPSGLAFKPVALDATPFARLAPIGYKVETTNGVASRLYRGFRTPEGRTVTLFEHDMSADGARMWRDPARENERVNGLPARLAVWQTGSGKAVSHLSWSEGRRSYELWVDANVANRPAVQRQQLFALAASLPASVAGCADAPAPAARPLGPDGRPTPVERPATMTPQQMEALFKRSQGPCK